MLGVFTPPASAWNLSLPAVQLVLCPANFCPFSTPVSLALQRCPLLGSGPPWWLPFQTSLQLAGPFLPPGPDKETERRCVMGLSDARKAHPPVIIKPADVGRTQRFWLLLAREARGVMVSIAQAAGLCVASNLVAQCPELVT